MLIKVIMLTLIFSIIFLSSCNSLYKNLNIIDIDSIKISRYQNYYETEPYSEIHINNKKDINKIIRYLKILPGKGKQNKDFHTFKASKLSLEIISKEKSAVIYIIEDRVEIEKYMYYRNLYYWEKKLVFLINSY